MAFRIEGNKVIIEFDENSSQPSKSGKTLILASSNGFVWAGNIGISFNIVKRR